jgi:hypothetical protein
MDRSERGNIGVVLRGDLNAVALRKHLKSTAIFAYHSAFYVLRQPRELQMGGAAFLVEAGSPKATTHATFRSIIETQIVIANETIARRSAQRFMSISRLCLRPVPSQELPMRTHSVTSLTPPGQ